MPTIEGFDSNGPYMIWGNNGKKYYYTAGDENSKQTAISLANRQGRAIYAHGYKPH
jgi:hypothetical protein